MRVMSALSGKGRGERGREKLVWLGGDLLIGVSMQERGSVAGKVYTDV